jgi:hypothetical protein
MYSLSCNHKRFSVFLSLQPWANNFNTSISCGECGSIKRDAVVAWNGWLGANLLLRVKDLAGRANQLASVESEFMENGKLAWAVRYH